MDYNKSSPDESSSNEEKRVIKDSKKEEAVHNSLGDIGGGVQVWIEERIFEPK